MISKILIANRGEIAVRIVRACQDLGLKSVAVYSDADREARHVRFADEAYRIGPPPSQDSYLAAETIIDTAKRCGADAIHPGYGFLAESAEFAEACSAAGITFVGPPPAAIRLLGDKVAARRLAIECGLPVVPGTVEPVAPQEAEAKAAEIGFPLLLKAAAGGGGKGIRVVGDASEVLNAIDTASREARNAFGDERLYIERYLSPVRHIEVQVIADRHGNVVALGERECSVQRRHQKLIEEAPSAALEDYQRGYIFALSVRLAKAAGYENVGTVEFLLDNRGEFYFIEMNTRLQVEHPVTEMITGVDLVADQIRTAAGEPLPYGQRDVNPRGWAIECRIAAEDPFNNFLPSVGRTGFSREPAGPGIRVESGLYPGVDVSVYYDPLLAKVTAWGRDRDEAIRRMRRALREFELAGLQTNVPFLQFVLHHPRFVAGGVDTSFVEQYFDADELVRERYLPMAVLTGAVLAARRTRSGTAAANRAAPATPSAPWRTFGRRRAHREPALRPRGLA
jgi:acetyl-CoA carboxylase biotin carboxylase subunit